MPSFLSRLRKRLTKMSSPTVLEKVKNKTFEDLPDLNNPGEHDYIYCSLPNGAKQSITEPLIKVYPNDFVSFPWSGYDQILMNKLKTIAASRDQSFAHIHSLIQGITNISEGDSTLFKYYKTLSDKDGKRLVELIAKMAELAARGPELFPQPIRYLKSKLGSSSATLSQEQCACLMAHCFFCTFAHLSSFEVGDKFNIFHMRDLFTLYSSQIAVLKWKFFFTYFEKYFGEKPEGVVSFRRAKVAAPNWSASDEKMADLEIRKGGIEDCYNCIQMDFADRYIGGITLRCGLLQEEIRFLICPEMIVSSLLIPIIEEDEAVFIVGAQRYSSYYGYDLSTQWKPFTGKLEARDQFGRLRNELVAVDAFEFGRFASVRAQFEKKYVDRELLKLYAGFASSIPVKSPVATGNWGCGAFCGNLKLKALLQLIAASKAGRDVVYCPFSEESFAKGFKKTHELLVRKEVTIKELYNLVIRGENFNADIFDYVGSEISYK